MAIEVIRKNTDKKEAVAEASGVATNQNTLAETKVPETQKTEIQKEVGSAEIFKKAAALNNIQVSEAELAEVRAAGREYRELLATFRAAGFEIKPEKGMVELPSKSGNPLYDMEILGSGDNKWIAYDSAHPKEILMYNYGANLHMDPNLAAKGKLVEFPVFGIKVDKTESGDKHLKIFNYLDVDKPLVYSAILEKDRHPAATSDIANDIRKALYRGFQKIEAKYPELVAEPSAAPAQAAVTVDYTCKTDSHTQAVLAKLANLSDPLTFRAVPEGFASDQSYRSGFLGKPFQVKLTSEMLKNTAAHPMVIKGDLQEVQFEDAKKFNLDRERGT